VPGVRGTKRGRGVKNNDEELMCALIAQVAKACPKGKAETSVTTIITRPLWRQWCRAVGMPQNSKPTGWIGIDKTNRIYGSETIVVESKAKVAISFVKP